MALTAFGGKAFTQFAELTGPTIYTSNKDVINDAQKTNYGTLGYMLRGQQMSDVLRGGSVIQDRIYLSATNKDISYLPGQDIAYSISETGTQWSADWRFFLNYIAWSDEAVMLNSGGSRSSKEARFHAYKDYWFELQQNLHTDQANAWETRMWAVPNAATMEASGAKEMFSIPTFITENDSGQHPLGPLSVDYNGGDVVAGIDPDVHAKWANHVETYPSLTGFSVGVVTNVLQNLDLAYKSTDFRPPPMSQEYFENPQKAQRPMPWIACSKDGHSKLIFLYRESKDRWVDMKDPFFTPTYAGAPIVYVGELDTAALYNLGGTALATEAAATFDGPRYYGIQPQYLRMAFHEDRYFESLGTFTEKSQPTTHVMPINTWGQLVPRSRARHFIIAPAD